MIKITSTCNKGDQPPNKNVMIAPKTATIDLKNVSKHINSLKFWHKKTPNRRYSLTTVFAVSKLFCFYIVNTFFFCIYVTCRDLCFLIKSKRNSRQQGIKQYCKSHERTFHSHHSLTIFYNTFVIFPIFVFF